MRISDVMTPCPYNIEAKSSLDHALRLMGMRGIRHLPVVEDGNLLGVLSERDAKLSKFVCETTGYCASVGVVCMKTPFVVGVDHPLSEALREMAEKKIDCALVSDAGGNFLGIFTTTDACRVLSLLLEEKELNS